LSAGPLPDGAPLVVGDGGGWMSSSFILRSVASTAASQALPICVRVEETRE